MSPIQSSWGVWGVFSAVLGNDIFAGGGYREITAVATPIQDTGTYHVLTDTYTDFDHSSGVFPGRAFAFSGAYGDRFFVAGGQFGSPSWDGKVFYWDLSDGAWVEATGQLAIPPGGTGSDNRNQNAGAWVQSGSLLHMMGGAEQFPVANALSLRHQAFDMAAPNSDAIYRSPLPLVTYCGSAAVLNGKAHFLGGWSGSVSRTSHWVYDFLTDTWDTTSYRPLPSARWGGVAAVTDGRLFYSGGMVGVGNTITDEHLEWDERKNRWIVRAPMPEGRAFATGQGHNDGEPSINIFGGLKPPGAADSDIVRTNYRYYTVPLVGSKRGPLGMDGPPDTPAHGIFGFEGQRGFN